MAIKSTKPLTDRERQVLRLLVNGYSNDESSQIGSAPKVMLLRKMGH